MPERYRLIVPGIADPVIIESIYDVSSIPGGWVRCTDGRQVNLDVVFSIEKLP